MGTTSNQSNTTETHISHHYHIYGDFGILHKYSAVVLWSLLIYNLSAALNTGITLAADWDKTLVAIAVAPIIEEFLKFVAARVTLNALGIGMGMQVCESIGYGIVDGWSKLVISPHWVTMLPYTRWGLRWRVLPIAIAMHTVWNMYWRWGVPGDHLALIGILSFLTWAVWRMMKWTRN